MNPILKQQTPPFPSFREFASQFSSDEEAKKQVDQMLAAGQITPQQVEVAKQIAQSLFR